VLYEGQLIDVPVTLGLSGDSQTEVVSGLQEGDAVLINQTTTTARGGAGRRGGLYCAIRARWLPRMMARAQSPSDQESKQVSGSQR